MEKKKLIVFIIGIVITAGILLAINAQRNLENPQTCNLCHEMKPFVASYLKPEQGSAISKHKIDCLGCHTNNSYNEARAAVMKEIEIGAFKKITGIQFNTTRHALAVNCTRCHKMEDLLHSNATASSCRNCHWAHKPLLTGVKTTGSSVVPVGPHKNQSCQNCHGTTFNIPRCINCHSGHGEEKLENALCLSCHTDPHVPKKPGILSNNTVKFTWSLSFETCKPCHENEYSEVAYSTSLHTEMQTCTKCHESHGEKPGCNKCHPVMSQQKHPEFGCVNCHKSTQRPIIVTCYDCHGRAVHDITASAAIWNPK